MARKNNEAAMVIQKHLKTYLAFKQIDKMRYYKATVLNIEYFQKIRNKMRNDAQIKIAYLIRSYLKKKRSLIKKI